MLGFSKPKMINILRQHRRKQMESFFSRKEQLKTKKLSKVWNLEDSTGEHNLVGTLEGGQKANYVIFMREVFCLLIL